MAINTQKIGSIGRLLRKSFRQYMLQFSVMVGLGFLGGLFEGVGIASIIPLFYLMTGQTPAEGVDIITQAITRIFTILHVPMTPPLLLSFIVLLFILKAFVQFVVRYTNAIIVTRFEENMRRTLMRRTLGAEWPYLMRQKSGHLESIMIYDTDRASMILNVISNTIILCTTFTAYTVVAMTISWPITLTTLLIGGILFLLLKPVFYRIRSKQTEAALIQKEISHHVAEHMTSIKTIKAMALELPIIRDAQALFARLRQIKVSTAWYRQSSLAFIDPIGFIVIAVLFMVSYRQPSFSIASFAVIMYLVQKMFTYVGSISGQLQSINDGYPYLKAAIDWRRRSRRHAEHDDGTQPFALTRELAFEGVSFSYRPDQAILKDFGLRIGKGELIGLVGPSGVGKTTVVDLLLRLFNPDQGRITADGIDIREIRLADWRSHIAYMAQDAMLFNMSVRENIRFYGSATDQEIESAAVAANIHDVIVALPQGYDTPTGERGISLSGGQRQRVLLARALARKPAILILDEATSAVDNESETFIRQAIVKLHGTVTVIMISHRASSIADADRVITLE